MRVKYSAESLDAFVEESDRLGGPDAKACQDFWLTFEYVTREKIDKNLDPYSDEYAAYQMRVYEELSGHPYRIETDELTGFDMERHAAAINPYDQCDSTMMGIHLQRLAGAFSNAKVRRGELLLDMGCGWGLSSEVAAYLGLSVQGVDINPQFAALVNKRAARTRYPISASVGTFENFPHPNQVDLILFYECLHHAVNPLATVTCCAQMLRPGGRMMLAGEPINAMWWPHWGMRLDGLSVYCIRKFGWFENGWSMDFILGVFRRAGLVPVVYPHPDPLVGPVIVANKPDPSNPSAAAPAESTASRSRNTMRWITGPVANILYTIGDFVSPNKKR